MIKKLVSICLVAVMAVSLAACGAGNSGKTEQGSSQSGEEAKGGKTLEFWVSWSPGEKTEKENLRMIEEYEKASGNKVNATVYTYDMLHDKILSAAAGGNTPDLIWGLPEWVGEFYNMGILEDLTDRFNGWDGKGDLSDAVLKAMTIDNKVVGIPYEMTVRAYLNHESAFKEAGATVPASWEEMLKLDGFKEKTGKYPFEITSTGVRSPQELIVYLAQYDLEICSQQEDGKFKNTWMENPEQLEKATKVFQYYKDCMDKGVVDPSSKNWGWEETDENFATGLVASHVTGNWLAEREESNPDTMNDIVVSAIPAPADGKQATYMECKPLFIFNSSKNKEEAFDLATAVFGKDWQEAAFAERSPRTDVFTDTIWSKDFTALAETGITFPPVTLGGITQAMIDSIAKVLQEGKTPKEAAEWLSKAVNASLSDSGELSE